jgi:hypothetical protein
MSRTGISLDDLKGFVKMNVKALKEVGGDMETR